MSAHGLSTDTHLAVTRSPHDVQRHGLMCVAAEATDFKIVVPGIKGVAEHGRRLGWSLISEHALVPSLAGKFVGFLARLGSTFGSCPDRTAVKGFA